MARPRPKKKRRFVQLLVLSGLVLAAFNYRERQFRRAPQPSWPS